MLEGDKSMRLLSVAIISVSSSLVPFLSAIADQADPVPKETVTVAAPPYDPDRIVCKPGEPPAGSRLPGPQQCLTQRQWKQRQADGQHALNAAQMRSLQSIIAP
jgi:hypothetical protein